MSGQIAQCPLNCQSVLTAHQHMKSYFTTLIGDWSNGRTVSSTKFLSVTLCNGLNKAKNEA